MANEQFDGGEWRKKAGGAFMLLAISGSLLLLMLFLSALKEFRYIGRNIDQQTTVTVSGDGEEYAAPDIAEVTFSVTHTAKTATEARNEVTKRTDKVLAFIKSSGVEDKDVKTLQYSLYPKYEWREARVAACLYDPCPPVPEGKQVLVGYEVTQSVNVKVRDLDNVGTILGGVVENGATSVSGPNFRIENEDTVIAAAREEAIAEAKAKAEVLADQLGVKLVRIVSFSEGYNYPIYVYGRGGAADAMMKSEAAAAPSIPAGENQYVSNVTIVYEIQ